MIPGNITRENVLKAITEIKKNGVPSTNSAILGRCAIRFSMFSLPKQRSD